MRSLILSFDKPLLRRLWFVTLLFFVAFNTTAQGQNMYYLYVIPADDSVKPNGSHRTMASAFVDSIFDHFEVTSYQYFFPEANNPRLAATCDLHALGDILELKTVLDSSGVFSLIELAEYSYIPISTVDEMTMPSNGLKIYPNPASGILHVTLNNNNYTIEQLEIYDLTGKKIDFPDTKVNSNKTTIDVSNMSKGIYLLKVKTKNIVLTKKVSIH